MDYLVVLFSLLGLATGFTVAYCMTLKKVQRATSEALSEQAQVLENAERKAENLLKESQLEAKSRLLEMKSRFDAETEETRLELKKEAIPPALLLALLPVMRELVRLTVELLV